MPFHRQRATPPACRYAGLMLGLFATAFMPLRALAQAAGGPVTSVFPVAPSGPAPFDPTTPPLLIQPGLDIEETITDNARGNLASGTQIAAGSGVIATTPGKKRGDLVTRITPRLNVIDRTYRFSGGLDFTPSFEKYTDNADLDRFTPTLTATGEANLWPEHLTLDAAASLSRQVVNSQGALTAGGRAIDTNQSAQQTYTIGPTFRQRLGDFAEASVHYLFGSTTADVSAPATQNQVTAALDSANNLGRLHWNLSAQDTEVTQGGNSRAGQNFFGIIIPTKTANTTQRNAILSAEYALNHTVRLLSSVGYETIDNGTLAHKDKGLIGSVGFGLTGNRATLDLSATFRYGGHFVSGHGNYDITPRMHLQVSYDQSITTQQQQALNLLSGAHLVNTTIVDASGNTFTAFQSLNGINNNLGNAAFHDRLGTITLVGTLDRNSYSLGIRTENQSTETTNFNEGSYGAVATYGRSINEATNFFTYAGYTRTNQRLPTKTVQDLYTISVGLTHQLGRHLSASVTYDWLDRESNPATLNTQENALVVGLHESF